MEFETQWHFNKNKNLKRGRSSYLSFDFYLPDYNLCIEYDGEQHYKEMRYSKDGKSGLDRVMETDLLKNKFCLQHNIKLIRIAYNIIYTPKQLLYLIKENFSGVINVYGTKHRGITPISLRG